jgi:MarR family transcriptional regulator, organic hydroperoxide resistance regulator
MATVTHSTAAARQAWALLFELSLANRARLSAALEELDLTFPQAHALRLLDPERPLPMSEIAERLVCDASNVTGIADRLEARSLVERRTGEDRRVKTLALTPKGIEVRRQVIESMRRPPDAIAALPQADQRALRDILRRAVELAGR